MRRFVLISLCAWGTVAAGQGLGREDLAPMKWIEPMAPEAAQEPKYPEYADVMDRARMQAACGLYRRAVQTLRLKAPAGEGRDLLLGQVLLKEGRYPEALQTLKKLEGRAEVAVLRARAMAGMGQRAQAAEMLAGMTDSPSAALHVELARLLESMGRLSEQAKALDWFAQQKFIEKWRGGQLSTIESADELVAIAEGVNRLAMAKGMFRDDLSLHQDILAMFTRAYDVLDRRNVEAHLRAAEFFATHDDEHKAGEELEEALGINPNDIAAQRLRGELAMKEYDFATCEDAIGAILKVREDHPDAMILTAELLLIQRLPEDAKAICTRLAKGDPTDAEALALLAACEAMTFNEKALASKLAEIDAVMPESSLAYVVCARFMTTAFQFKDAAKLLHVAVQRTPNWNVPRNLLALAYMQQTDMEKARPILEEARKLDPFNVETTNYMRLLDTLAGYRIVESDHFKVRYSAKDDPFLADEVLTYMEWNYGRLTREYGWETPEKTVIELMPTSEDFAVRTTGKPWLATIGASTGPVITLVAPRSYGKTNGAFDWTDVCRHEFVHTVTLGATHHRIPRWFTEGLAVSEQTNPLSMDQAKLLASAVAKNRLFPVRRINWSFIRPRQRGDASQAYAQSMWLCRYIQQTHGFGAILSMMQGYAQGLQTEQVVQRSLKMSSLELDTRFAEWAKAEVTKLGLDTASQMKLRVLSARGEEQIKAKDYEQALKTWEEAYAISPIDPLVNQRLAGLYLLKSIDKPEQAARHLHLLDQQQLKDNRFAMRLAKLYESTGELDKALASARRATEIDPYDKPAREGLARVLEKLQQPDAARKQREIMAMIPVR